MDKWIRHYRCPCGKRHFDVPFNDTWFLHGEVCGGCGREPWQWEQVIGRKVSAAVWWQPWTWFRAHWEEQ